MTPDEAVARAGPDRPVLVAGPTASGKSGLALAIVAAHGGRIVNADALQVYDTWRILTARPGPDETARAPHLLYGHVGDGADYSVGHWLREVAPLLSAGPRPVIVGGTGLYLSALTEGLADIPPVPTAVRARADALHHDAMLAALDADTRARIDPLNPARVKRAWEVQEATGRPLARWQDETPPPLLPPGDALALVVEAPRDVLTPRIEARFDAMLEAGALDEVRAVLPGYDPGRPAHRAIGAPELAAHLRDEIDLATARERAIVATRRYAKRQRTWFRARMGRWESVEMPA